MPSGSGEGLSSLGHASRERLLGSVTGHLDAEALYRAHATFVARFLVRLGAPRQDIPDLVQDVFLVAHRRGGFVPHRAKPTTWLAEIAFRVASDRRKRRARKPEDAASDVLELSPSHETSPGDRAEARDGLRRVEAALGVLSPEKRAVFILFELEGEGCEAIAQGLGIPVGTVYSRLHAARREFAKAHAKLVEGSPRPRSWRESLLEVRT